MKNISFLSEDFQFLMVKISVYLNRRVFVMKSTSLPVDMLKMLDEWLTHLLFLFFFLVFVLFYV